ncbi:MAG: metallophosphoesterase [Terracidiphilus sp.]|nr:metallophosphoesterase [Terracidiphilus sp.]
MVPAETFPPDITRRSFLRQSFAFSALAALGSGAGFAATSKVDPGGREILFIGDWGYEDATAQAKVAAGMTAYARQHAIHPEAFLLLGDNWYGALEGGVDSSRWYTNFEQMYPADVFNCPAYALLGNHDYQYFPQSKVDAELEYARRGKTRWTMPSRWYRFEFPAHDPLITFIALDSNMPSPKGPQASGRNFTLTEEQRLAQLAWLEQELAKPRTTPYLAVIAHHPIYSNGPHGDHATLIRDWDPLLRKHGVTLYMAGHDHDLQHLEFEGHPTSFFLSGGGGADLYDLKVDPAHRGPYAAKIYGFSHLSVTRERMTLRHLDSDGRLLHEFSKSATGQLHLAG